MSDLLAFLSWWLIAAVFGAAAWPLLFRLFRFLPDRGYSLSKTGGLLAVGYAGWLLGNLGYVRVSAGGVVVSLLIVAGASLAALRGSARDEMAAWWRANRLAVIAVELLFLAAFGLWAYVRALNPNITFTEKPMEFAFLNSVLRTGTQPPGDPWLAGYAISYYHFGYVIIGMLIALSGAQPSVGFNLGVALLFALTAAGAFGVVLNLAAAHANGASGQRASTPPAILPALLGPLFMLIGNLNGFFEVMHKVGVFSPAFWAWLDIKWTSEPPAPTGGWMPDRFLWWWQSSRVIHDRDLFGKEIEVIDEFPFFSFLLGDMHPHVLGLPFVFLGIAFALNLFLAAADKKIESKSRWLPLPWPDTLGGAIILGGLSFLNTWDFPIYVFVAAAAFAVGASLRGAWTRDVWRGALLLAAELTALGALLYLPFYIGFRSQLGGLLPNLVFGTRIQQFVVMFGPSLFVVLSLAIWHGASRRRELDWRGGMTTALAILVSLIVLCAALGAVIVLSPLPGARQAVDSLLGGGQLSDGLRLIIARRLEIERVITPALLTLIVGAAAAAIFSRRAEAGGGRSEGAAVTLMPFVFVLIATGALLTLGPEFVYLRDLFGWRMNTIFKFYYQAWVVWSLAAAFGAWLLWRSLRAAGRAAFGAGLAVVAAMGLIYPVLATTTITEDWKGTTRAADGEPYATLDGMAYMPSVRPADYEAINFLNRSVKGRPVIAEAVGGSYTDFARVSAHTGLPTVLGWPFHELQWRGEGSAFAGREDDIRTLYSARTWVDAKNILDKYDIEYVYVGPMEVSAYGPGGLAKFDSHMRLVYQADGVTIYVRNDK